MADLTTAIRDRYSISKLQMAWNLTTGHKPQSRCWCWEVRPHRVPPPGFLHQLPTPTLNNPATRCLREPKSQTIFHWFSIEATFVSPPHQGADPRHRRVPTSFTRHRLGEDATDLKNGKLVMENSSGLNADLPYIHRSTVWPLFQKHHWDFFNHFRFPEKKIWTRITVYRTEVEQDIKKGK